jgi:serine protease Do
MGGSVACVGAFAAENDPAQVVDAIQREVQIVYEKSRDAIVRIEATDALGYLSGTGFFIDPNGTLYTSYTIGGESRNIQVFFGGIHYHAERLVSDNRSGIAILKINAQTRFLTVGNSRQLAVATPVIAVGYPLNLDLTPIFGTVGGFDLKYQNRYFATTHIRANISAQRGEGGAPVLNTRGEAVGVLISRIEGGNASYVLPIEAAEKVRKDFVRFHDVRPGWIGVQVKPTEEAVNGSTAVIEEVLPDGPGKAAGLQPGDVIVQVGSHRIASPDDLRDASFFLSAGDETLIRIARDGSERDFNITPVSHPELAPIPTPAIESPTDPAHLPIKIDR